MIFGLWIAWLILFVDWLVALVGTVWVDFVFVCVYVGLIVVSLLILIVCSGFGFTCDVC